MIYGVTIGEVNTLEQWDLLLCADLVVGTPPLKSNLIDLPGRSGSVNMSYAASNGLPVYGDRQIAFTLFAPVDDVRLNQIRSELAELCHGQEATLKLPTDSNYYYRGIFAVGDISGYNSGKIPVSVIAEPYAYKNNPTTRNLLIHGSGSISTTLNNDMMPTTATITATDSVTVAIRGATYSISAGAILAVPLPAGNTQITVSGADGTEVTITYQQGRI